MLTAADVAGICLGASGLGFVFSLLYAYDTSMTILDPKQLSGKEDQYLLQSVGDQPVVDMSQVNSHFDPRTGDPNLKQEYATRQKIWDIYLAIWEGAHAFLYAEYRFIAMFVVGFSIIILVVLGVTDSWINAALTMVSFIVGCVTSVVAGFLGMKIGVYANARTTVAVNTGGLNAGFQTSFKAAVVMGFVLCSMGILNLFILIACLRVYYTNACKTGFDDDTRNLFECVAGYGLGGSCIGLFGRVGGGIYTKAADVGADLVGKLEANIPEDSPKNPAVIADNVGDNVGDIAGMGADLFGSFAEATCAGMVIASQGTIANEWGAIALPILISAGGIFVCFVTSFVATHCFPIETERDIEPALKRQILVSTVLMTPVLYLLCWAALPYEIASIGGKDHVKYWQVFICAASGLWCGLIIGYITEYYTSHSWGPVREVAVSCKTGAATNIIYGMALGYKSVVIPAIALAVAAYIAHSMAGYYGVAMAALGILSTLSIGLTIDAYGPICDNAGGIAEMAELGEEVRDQTDALDAAGNTTAAIGKGFAIGSAAFVSLALFSGFITIIKVRNPKFAGVDILNPWPFSGLLFGAMLPYWFSAMTMKSVGAAALAMVNEVREQFRNNPGILQGEVKPDYQRCIRISTEASLTEMVPPGILVMGTPLIVGFLFGVECLAGVLCGALVSGVQMAISSSNTGGAWDNAKKFVEADGLVQYADELGQQDDGLNHGKGSDTHKAAVVGDTVGDPLKDTSGPSLNILIKLMAIISLVFAKAFPLDDGGLLGRWLS